MISTIVGIIVYIMSAIGIYQLILPTLSFRVIGGTLFILIFGSMGIVLGYILYLKIRKKSLKEISYKFLIIEYALILITILIGAILSSTLFNSKKMYNQLGEIKDEVFTEDISPIDNTQIPTVDKELAKKQGEKELGKISSLGSQVTLGDFTMCQVNGKLLYVAPLEHTGFFKWSSQKTTPAYITVSATDSSDVKMIKEVNGEEVKLKYLHSAFLGDDLIRHIRNSGYRSEGLTDYSFELNDEGRPYYVITVFENKAIWGMPEATGVLICDVQTGEINKYNLNEVPEWVDRVQPEKFINEQINNYGKLIHGVFNFSNKDKIQKTPDTITVYNNGNCYYYTGLTSVGSDEATVGFIMVDTKTKKAVRFSMGGATEDAAMRSAEGLVQDMEYKATEPVPLNLNGIPTYFMTLKDQEGLVKQYALVNIQNYSVSVVGNTIDEVKRNYVSKMNTTQNKGTFSDESYKYVLEGNVSRISSNVEGGNTFYFMVLDSEPKKVFMASYTISEELPITNKDDKVKIYCMDDKETINDILKFDNLNFGE